MKEKDVSPEKKKCANAMEGNKERWTRNVNGKHQRRASFGESPERTQDGVVCTLASTHYMVEGALGVR